MNSRVGGSSSVVVVRVRLYISPRRISLIPDSASSSFFSSGRFNCEFVFKQALHVLRPKEVTSPSPEISSSRSPTSPTRTTVPYRDNDFVITFYLCFSTVIKRRSLTAYVGCCSVRK